MTLQTDRPVGLPVLAPGSSKDSYELQANPESTTHRFPQSIRRFHHNADASDEVEKLSFNSTSEQDLPTEESMLYTFEEEQAVLRKFDRRLVLFIAFLYMLGFLDRSST